MRGSRTLYGNLCIETNIDNKPKPGRNIDLIVARNKAIVYRYCFHSINTNKRYELIIALLSKEFFLSERTVIQILLKNNETILEIKKKNLQSHS